MDIRYKNKRIEKICTNIKTAERTYGRELTEKLQQRIGEISASDAVEVLVQFHIGRCHSLSQNREGQYAMDLIHPYRLIFEIYGTEIQKANILEIADYH